MPSKSFISSFVRHSTGDWGSEQVQNNLENSFRAVEGCDLIDGHLLTEVELASGDNDIDHKLSREIKGWIITRYREATANVYEKISDNENTGSLLKLNSSGATTVDIWVF